MSVERPDFLKAYDAVEVPTTMHSMDAIDEQVRDTSDAFFEAIRDSLDLSSRSLVHLFEIDYRMLVPMYGEGTPAQEKVIASDDYIRVFRRRGGQTLASIMYTRDDPNYQDAHFAKYPLRPVTIEQIRAFQKMERIELGLE